MKEKTTETSSKLAGAGYIFLLKEKAASLADLRRHLLQNYQPLGPDKQTELSLQDPDAVHYYLENREAGEQLDVHVGGLANVLCISILSFLPEPGYTAWDGQTFLDGCQAALTSSDADILGSAIVKFSGEDMQPALSRLKEAAGAPLVDISADIDGRILHQLVAGKGRQYFIVEGESTTSFHDFVALDLPQIAWSIRRLEREWDFYSDRLEAIRAEKHRIDDELSQIFHHKVGDAMTSDASRTLENQIYRLSSMYSILATDLHLIKEGSGTIDKDLVVLNRLASAFTDVGDDRFPYYHLSRFRDNLKSLLKHESDLRQSLENTKAAIDIAQTQAELLRGSQGLALQEQTRELLNQNVVLQDERMSLQVAAQVVELVVVFYYTLKSWEAVAVAGTVDTLPSLVKFGVVATFSASVVVLTHFIGSSLHERRVMVAPTATTAVLVALSLGAMAVLPGILH